MVSGIGTPVVALRPGRIAVRPGVSARVMGTAAQARAATQYLPVQVESFGVVVFGRLEVFLVVVFIGRGKIGIAFRFLVVLVFVRIEGGKYRFPPLVLGGRIGPVAGRRIAAGPVTGGSAGRVVVDHGLLWPVSEKIPAIVADPLRNYLWASKSVAGCPDSCCLSVIWLECCYGCVRYTFPPQ